MIDVGEIKPERAEALLGQLRRATTESQRPTLSAESTDPKDRRHGNRIPQLSAFVAVPRGLEDDRMRCPKRGWGRRAHGPKKPAYRMRAHGDGHYENFPVASRFVPPPAPHVGPSTVARTATISPDEHASKDARRQASSLGAVLEACYHRDVDHPVFLALRARSPPQHPDRSAQGSADASGWT